MVGAFLLRPGSLGSRRGRLETSEANTTMLLS